MQGLVQLLADAAQDPGTATRLKANPRAALATVGVELPPDVTVRAWQNDATTVHLVLPIESAAEREAARRVNPKLAKLFEQAWGDAASRSRLMAQPRETFIEATGATPPPWVRFEAHENTPTTFHVVIPAPALSGELSDRDLERVAGGFALPSCDQVGAAGVLGMIVGGEVVGGSIHSVTNVNETQAAIGAGVAVAGFAMVVGSIVASHS